MFHAKVTQKYWIEAFFTANFLSKFLPHTALDDSKSPCELLHHRRPDYRALRVFGCACFPMLSDYTVNKLDPRSLKSVFLGYSEKFKGYRSLLPTTGRVYITRHDIFDEMSFPFADSYSHLHQATKSVLLKAWQDSFVQHQKKPPEVQKPVKTTLEPISFVNVSSPMTSSVDSTSTSIFTSEDFPPLTTTTASQAPTSVPRPSISTTSCEELRTGCMSGLYPVSIGNSEVSLQARPVLPSAQATSSSSPPSSHPMITRSKAGIVKPNPRYALLTQKAVFPTPKSVSDALKHPGWNNAMSEKI